MVGRARVFVSVLLLLTLPACSFLFVEGPADHPPKYGGRPHSIDCTTNVVAPVFDTVFAASDLAGIAYNASQADRQPEEITTAAIIGGVAGVILFGASAIYGYSEIASCREAKRALAEPSSPAVQWSGPSAPYRPAHSPPRATPTGSGVGGFELGWQAARAKSWCTASGLKWTGGEDDGAWCTGLPDDKAATHAGVQLRFANDAVVEVAVWRALATQEGAAWVRAYKILRKHLTKLHGKAFASDRTVPERCKPVNEFVSCLKTGDAAAQSEWVLDGNRRIQLSMGEMLSPDRVAIVVRYSHLEPEEPNDESRPEEDKPAEGNSPGEPPEATQE